MNLKILILNSGKEKCLTSRVFLFVNIEATVTGTVFDKFPQLRGMQVISQVSPI